jgi:ABC-2 type transport system ATP-binding protein
MLNANTPALAVKNLQKTYAPSDRFPNAVTALKGLSFEIRTGEIFALLGPNGSGKSTTINVISGLVIPTAGSAEVFGKDAVRDYREVRSSVGVVPQEITFDPFFSVADALEIQAGLYGVPPSERWNKELLERLSLSSFAKANPRMLSGGMKRRLLVAKALVHKPKLLILDEPTAGVDVELRRGLWEFVRELNRDRGTSVLLTTHHMEEAETLANRIGIIAKGELRALDSLGALKSRFGKESLEDIYLEITNGTAPKASSPL